MSSHSLLPALLILLMLWRIRVRLRRTIGPQPLILGRLLPRALIFGALIIFLGATTFKHGPAALGLGSGVLPGIVLGLLGLKLTRFGVSEKGRFYVPNTYIGMGVVLLFVGRMIYRILEVYQSLGNSPPPGSNPMTLFSPYSLFSFGLLAGYYTTYYTGLCIEWRKSRS